LNYYPDQKVYENKRVVLITGNQSKWYEQAIFVIRKDAGRKPPPKDFVREAESIIDNYMRTLDKSDDDFPTTLLPVNPAILDAPKPKQRKRSNFDWVLNLTMLAACVVIFYILATRMI
jgi:hypothetical protein